MKQLFLLGSLILIFINTNAQFTPAQIKTYEQKYEKPYVIVDSTGKEIKTFYAKKAYSFHYGLARFSKYNMQTGKLLGGYMNTRGETVIPLQYKKVENFTEHAAIVKLPGHSRYTIIDRQGNPILDQTFIRAFCKGRYCTFTADDEEAENLKKRYNLSYKGVIDVIEKRVVLAKSKWPTCGISNIYNDKPPILTVVNTALGKSGYSTINNKMISDFFTDDCLYFGNKYGEGEKGIIDREGNVVYPYNGKKVYIASDKHDLVYRVVGKSELYNRQILLENFEGKRIVEDTLLSRISFEGDLAVITYVDDEKRDKNGRLVSKTIVQALIDYTGKFIIPKANQEIKFDTFDPNYIDVKRNGRWRRYNKDGSYFSKLDENKRIIFSAFGEANFSSYYDEAAGLYGIVNRKGEAITPPRYAKHFVFDKTGYAVAQLPKKQG